MKGSVSAGKGNSGRRNGIFIRRGLALLFAGCVLTGALAACGGDKDKDNEGGSAAPLDTSSTIPLNTSTPSPQPTAKAVKVEVDDSLNVRESGSTEANILGTVNDGDELALLTDTAQNGWYQVSYNGGTGYVAAEYVKVIEVTVDRYNQLKNANAATPTTAPAGTAGPEGGDTGSQAASASPNGGNSGGQGGTASSDNEDGE